MENLRKYFDSASESANESYLSADGYEGWEDIDGDMEGDDYNPEEYTGVVGGRIPTAPTSQPYIISLENTTTNNVSDVTIFKAYENITATANGVATGISLTMGITGVTYTELLYQALNRPFVVGLMYIQSDSSSAQVLETIKLEVRDSNGNIQSKILVPTIDPYQQQSDIVAVQHVYKMDGFTSLTVNRVLASKTMKIYLYPAENVAVSRGLVGKPVAKGYGNPHVVKGDKVVLSSKVARQLRG